MKSEMMKRFMRSLAYCDDNTAMDPTIKKKPSHCKKKGALLRAHIVSLVLLHHTAAIAGLIRLVAPTDSLNRCYHGVLIRSCSMSQ